MRIAIGTADFPLEGVSRNTPAPQSAVAANVIALDLYDHKITIEQAVEAIANRPKLPLKDQIAATIRKTSPGRFVGQIMTRIPVWKKGR